MDVTILIAPKGCTRNPVVFKPSARVFAIPESENAKTYLEEIIDRISKSYHNGIYYVTFFGEPCSMEEFRKYVMHREEDRCAEERSLLVQNAYAEVVSIYMGKGDFLEHRATLNHYLRKLMHGIDSRFCRWILYRAATPTGYVDLEGFDEIIREAETLRNVMPLDTEWSRTVEVKRNVRR